MTIHIHDSLTGSKKPLNPLVAGKVGMYVCGVTVYDLCHLGHARVNVVFDTVARYLRHRGYEVNYVRNITDIDDKIILRANERGVDFKELTQEFTQAMHDDCEVLGCESPTVEPTATGHVAHIIALIERLEKAGYTYATDAGDVYYRVRNFDGYGKLSNRSLDDLRAGERVDVDESKEDPLDFVLWKGAKPGEPQWESPWGGGRPGWHIECSAMAGECLGDTFDIHAGGMDLKFPHHENEIAQSEAATGKQFANIWMHNGHYRSPLNYTDDLLDSARASLERLYMTRARAAREATADGSAVPAADQLVERFTQVMDDDFNTPEAVAVLHEIATAINRALDAGEGAAAAALASALDELADTLGLLALESGRFLGTDGAADDVVADGLTRANIETLLENRTTARANKDFAEADRIRDQLDAAGVAIEDVAGGKTSWRLKA